MEVLLRTFAVVLSSILFSLSSVRGQNPAIQAIYQFGDSISDTGNGVKEGGGCGYPPYGETFPHYPSGRCSDGMLIVDNIAQYFKMPLLNPYLNKSGDYTHGANFAVMGATALNVSTLASKGITASVTKSSLLVQLDWFKSHLLTVRGTPSACKQKLGNALVVVGEIGGNDYNFATFEGKPMDYLRGMVTEVVQIIGSVVKEVINMGATRVLVPGLFPNGCMPIYLDSYKSTDPAMYDQLGCLKSWNDFATFHNVQLQNQMKILQQQNSGVSIAYGDYFGALQSLLQQAPSQGIDKNDLYKACCGASGDNPKYNYDPKNMCGSSGATVCPNPNARVSWDGIHLTQHAYQYMAGQLLKQIRVML